MGQGGLALDEEPVGLFTMQQNLPSRVESMEAFVLVCTDTEPPAFVIGSDRPIPPD